MTQWVVEQLGKEGVSVRRSCEVLSVSRAGFYEARQRWRQPASGCALSVKLRAVFQASGGTYGRRRLKAALAEQGVKVGHYRIRRLMQEQALRSCWKRQFRYRVAGQTDAPLAPNVLNRQFQQTAPNRAWVSDITYIPTRQGWLYLAAVLDLYSRKVVGWAMGATLQAELVCRALKMAITTRNPPPGLIVHSDQGCQYTSEAYRALLTQHGLIYSLSRRANCWDNAVMERFFLNLKMERVWQRDYLNHNQAQCDVANYIVAFYNPKRLHSSLGYLAPNDFEREMN